VKPNRPNVIIMLVDDAGYVDFGFMGSKDLLTPEIDKLAASGTVFTDAHVSATVCAPSRAGLMTGKYQQRFGFEANGTGDEKSGDIGLSDDVVTMGDVFKNNGYKTYALGKWHLGTDESDHPNQRGFDEFYGFLSGSRSYFPVANPSRSNMLQHNGDKIDFTGYMTDVLGDQSVKYVEQSKEQPFFMYLAYNAVHTPMEAKEEDLEKFKDHPRQKLAAMTWSLDKNIGKLLAKLEEAGIRDNTIIYFLSDNGGAHNNNSKVGALKGWKGNKFEGGHRVPFILSWPQRLKGNSKFNGLTSSLDIFPTSLAAAEIKKPDDLLLDGIDLLPFLKGEKKVILAQA
jgi:arylsulfatase A-like enzyme